MSAWAVVRMVAAREIRERLRSRSFLVATLLSLAVLAAVAGLSAATGNDDDSPTYDVGAAPGRPTELVAVAADLAAGDARIDAREVSGRAEAERLLRNGDLDAAVVGDTVLAEGDLDSGLAALLQAANRELAIADVLAETGASRAQIAAATPEPLATTDVDRDGGTERRRGMAFIGTLLLYMQIFTVGFAVASGIVEEKASRVVELLLAKAGTRPLLTGKILGIGAVALAQLAIYAAVGLGLAAAVGELGLPPGAFGLAVALLGWFLLGFGLYACAFAVCGAIASRPEELQNTTGPLTLVIVVGFFASLFAGDDPHGTVARVATFLPPATPLVVPVRTAANAIAPWEVAVAAALMVAATLVVVRLAARVYAGGALATRGPLSIRAALARAED